VVTSPAEKIYDPVENVFMEFMLILFQYKYYPELFPLTIKTTNVGDSTVLQKKFNDVISLQNKDILNIFDQDIHLADLNKREANASQIAKAVETANTLVDNTNKAIDKIGDGVREVGMLNSALFGGKSKTHKKKPRTQQRGTARRKNSTH
jgi:hypothetical protein